MRKGGWATSEARKMSLEALEKRIFSLARTSVPKRNSTNKGNRKPTKLEEANRKARKYAEIHDTNDRERIERDFLTNHSQQMSDPDLTTYSVLSKSTSPKGQRPESGKSDSSRSSRDTPHPHHYDHPERHLPTDIGRGMVKSRSTSSLAALNVMRPKTPPSPHHHAHPISTLVPHGTTFISDGIKGRFIATKMTTEIAQEKQKELMSLKSGKTPAKKIASAVDEKKKEIEIQPKLETKDIDSSSGELTTRKMTNNIEHLISPAVRPTVQFDLEQRDKPVIITDADRQKKMLAKLRAKERASLAHTKVIYEKRKKPSEFTHVPVAKVTLDAIEFFLGETEIKAE